MSNDLRKFNVGDVVVTIINIGDVHEDLNRWYELSAEERTMHRDVLAQPARLPIQSIHLVVPGSISILVDAGAYDYPSDSPLLIPGYNPPPDLLTSLGLAEIDPKQITHVIITHAHGDHFNALTAPEGDRWLPVFPNARHYLGRGDWEKMQPVLANSDSLESRTFGVLQERGQLELVTHETEVASGVRIIPAPGESPGHQVVRVASGEEVLYCIGDLYHLPIEVEQPMWTLSWNDGSTNRNTRAALNECFVAENAQLVATHIVDVGRMTKTDSGFRWLAV
jgi:glyoxylase-like metal-dependent hydrolase (beta-lactamase superfamily II)